MVYNNVTNTLRAWCSEMTQRYCDAYQQERAKSGQSLRYLPQLVTSELQYKLGALIDRDFSDYDAYRAAIKDLMAFHPDPALSRKPGKIETHYIQTTEAAFRDYLDSLPADRPAPDWPYCRNIRGEEAERITARIYDAWGYDTTYWYPLDGKPGDGRFFIASQWVAPHWDEIRRLLDLPRKHIYEYGESAYGPFYCSEVDDLDPDAGVEYACCAMDFSWLIYFSHENTVTFAGTIVPRILEILHADREHWNRFEWID